MRIMLNTQYESDWAQGRWAEISSKWDKEHIIITSDPDEAEFIIFTMTDVGTKYEHIVFEIARNYFFSSKSEKIFVFDTSDNPIGLFPGVYASLRTIFYNRSIHRTGSYMQSFNEYVNYKDPFTVTPDLLFSFQGNETSRVRTALFAANFNRTDILIEKKEPFWADIGSDRHNGMKINYAHTMHRSRFVLCPRGIGSSSYRLFEAMQSGRVPVVISDNWVPPTGIDWDHVSLRVRERDVARLPEICASRSDQWREMGAAARRVWEHNFSEAGLGNFLRSSIAQIELSRAAPKRLYVTLWPKRCFLFYGRALAIRVVAALRRAARPAS